MIKYIVKVYEFIYNFTLIKYFKVDYTNFPQISGMLFLRNYGILKINSNIKINSKLASNPIGGDTRTIIYVKKGGSLLIGKGCGISNSTIFCTKEIVIGNNVYIGGSCKIYDTDFHSVMYKDRITLNDINVQSRGINIENGAFIGANCIILKGVNIGENSIIGAGSVVTRNIPSNQIWAGNPVRYIKDLEAR